MFKRILKWTAIILGVLILLAVIGIAVLIKITQSHLVPPPNPDDQKSIATYATPESNAPMRAPKLVADFSWDTITQPPKSARAWTRWWWPGGDVDTKTLLKQLDELDAAQFGGGEIQPFISGVKAVSKNEKVMERV